MAGIYNRFNFFIIIVLRSCFFGVQKQKYNLRSLRMSRAFRYMQLSRSNNKTHCQNQDSGLHPIQMHTVQMHDIKRA